MRVASLVLLLVVALGCTAFAKSPKVDINANNMALEQVAAMLSEQAGAQIVIDTGIKGAFTAELADTELEKALDLIAAANGLKWQKLYAKPDDEGKISMTSIKEQIAAVTALQDTPLVVFDPSTGKQTVFVRVAQKTADAVIDPAKLGMKAFYFIFKPKADVVEEKTETSAENVTEKFSQLRQQQLEMFMNMTPEEQKAAIEQELSYLMNMPATDQMNLMRSFSGAARDMDPQLRDQFRRTVINLFRGVRGR